MDDRRVAVAKIEYREDWLGRGVYWLFLTDAEGRWYAVRSLPASQLALTR